MKHPFNHPFHSWLAIGLISLVFSLQAQDAGQSGKGQAGTEPDVRTPISKLNSTYLLVPGDKIRFRIAQDPKPNPNRDELVVSSLGLVDFPVSQSYNVMIQMLVSGKTLDQVEEAIKEKLDEKYYFDSQISLQLVSQSAKTGFVLFHGSARGNLPLEPGSPKTLSQALIEIGWDEFANLKKVKVQRINPDTNKNEEFEVNVSDILNKNKRDLDVILKDGDRVHVPERSFVF